MKRKYKLKKKPFIVLILSITLIILLIFLIISRVKNKSYSLEYDISDYKISENYDSNNKVYYYEITYNKQKYNFIEEIDYQKDKKLISDISSYNEGTLSCLKIESDYFEANPLCNEEDILVDYRLNKEVEETEPLQIENYFLYQDIKDLYLWSYKKFIYFEDNKLKEIKLFDKDIYEIPLATKINEYIIVPDYEQEYSFNSVYIINTTNNKVDKWKLKYDISFDSYVLGINDKSLFILDKKENIEYELVPHKKKMRIVATKNKQATVYNYGEIEKVPTKQLVNSEYSFKYKTFYHYSLIDNQLYLSYLDSSLKTKVSNQKIRTIIATNKDEIYYLVDNTLFKYSLKNGEQKLISYSDWEFNYQNLIFIK